MDDLLKIHLTEQSKQNCLYICNKLTEWFAKNAVTVNVNNWFNDYSAGYDTARDNIKDYCIKKRKNIYEKFNVTEYVKGYYYALVDIINHIEGM